MYKRQGQWTQTFRVNADDKYADVRVRVGKVLAISEPASGNQSELDQLDIGRSAPIVYEVAIAQGGFNEDGSPSSSETAGAVKMRYFFDRTGGMFLRAEGNALIAFHKKLYLIVGDELIVKGKSGNLAFTDGLDINGGSSLTLKGKVVRLNGGKKAVAIVGSMVNVSIKLGMVLPGLVAPPGGGPVTGFLNLQNLMVGVVSSGDGTVLAGN